MRRILVLTLFALTGLLLTADVASAQWRFRRFGWVPATGHYHIHNGHVDYHVGRVNYYIPSVYGTYYPSTVYPNYPRVTWSSPVYSTYVAPTIVSSYASTPVVTGSTVVSAVPPAVNVLKPPVVYNEPSVAANSKGAVVFNSRPITIRNPSGHQSAITFRLNGQQVRLEPGQATSITYDRAYTIEFDRGNQYGTQGYSLRDGTFEFQIGDRGWDLRNASTAEVATPPLNAPRQTGGN